MIKFRAWDKVQKVMMVPRDMQTDSDGNIFYVEARSLDGEYDEGDLDVFEIEQFTGLKDVNGKDIYVGDIVKNERNESHIVSFILHAGCFAIGDYYFKSIGAGKILEIIGNVHENPELLKG